MIWAAVTLTACIVLLAVVIAVALARVKSMSRYTDAISNAWNADDESLDYADARITGQALDHREGDHDARILANHVVAMQQRSRTEIDAPEHSTLLATYGPQTGPYFVGIFQQQNTLIFAFRGTMTDDELKADMNLSQVTWFEDIRVHRGFLGVYRMYRDYLLKWLTTPHNRVYVTGHSLGGAVTSLLCLDLVERIGERDVFGVTFGAPRVGNEAFASRTNKSHLTFRRYANRADIITSLPPNLMPDFDTLRENFLYLHAGTEIAFTEHDEDGKNNHSMKMYCEFMDGVIE